MIKKLLTMLVVVTLIYGMALNAVPIPPPPQRFPSWGGVTPQQVAAVLSNPDFRASPQDLAAMLATSSSHVQQLYQQRYNLPPGLQPLFVPVLKKLRESEERQIGR